VTSPIGPRPRVYAFDQMPHEVVREGFSRVAVRGDDALVTLNWFQPGYRSAGQHHHPFDQLSFVFSGTLEFVVGDERLLVPSGSVLRIPAGVPHGSEPIGDEVVLNVDVFAPVRDDLRHLTNYQDVDEAGSENLA
jgi:quercetin dioxygenase-like cupin family protein